MGVENSYKENYTPVTAAKDFYIIASGGTSPMNSFGKLSVYPTGESNSPYSVIIKPKIVNNDDIAKVTWAIPEGDDAFQRSVNSLIIERLRTLAGQFTNERIGFDSPEPSQLGELTIKFGEKIVPSDTKIPPYIDILYLLAELDLSPITDSGEVNLEWIDEASSEDFTLVDATNTFKELSSRNIIENKAFLEFNIEMPNNTNCKVWVVSLPSPNNVASVKWFPYEGSFGKLLNRKMFTILSHIAEESCTENIDFDIEADESFARFKVTFKEKNSGEVAKRIRWQSYPY
ncbi:MAG: hypothetical protein WCO33_04535 [bacterium]